MSETEHFAANSTANFLKIIIISFNNLTDEREEWEKDIWDIRKLDKYGVTYIKSSHTHYIDFSKISSLKIREELKKYIKQKLIINNKFSWGSARRFCIAIVPFINLICEIEPTWNDFENLERKHILKYIEWLNIYTKKI
ncbi:hypothetical protein [Paraclostridium sordellii]|uniref:hypothetical protein n=1 Tax=Paraclostridium sordellii TaxID=1505 RepID=UPI001A9B497A|nr:hypothetical protein [Paeniclostridium sordellii]MCR1849101.1 hypothetical protein [Paeniclostridium sordellii]